MCIPLCDTQWGSSKKHHVFLYITVPKIAKTGKLSFFIPLVN